MASPGQGLVRYCLKFLGRMIPQGDIEEGAPYNGLYRVYIGFILGLYRDNGKENGNYYIIIGRKDTCFERIAFEYGSYDGLANVVL